MAATVTIKADFRGADLTALESYLKAVIAEATQAPIGNVVYHGVVRPDVDRLREQFGMIPRPGGR